MHHADNLASHSVLIWFKSTLINFRDIAAAQLGKGYMRFMLEAEDLISCEPKLDTSKLAPIMLEVPDYALTHNTHAHLTRM